MKYISDLEHNLFVIKSEQCLKTSNTIIQKVNETFYIFSVLAKTDAHFTPNTCLDTQRSEFVLFVIETQDNQRQDALKYHPRTKCWWPTIPN